jgi:hypothetical protein
MRRAAASLLVGLVVTAEVSAIGWGPYQGYGGGKFPYTAAS